ncbi:MAG TPA: HAMP domain-containing sensor histidine kinase [Gemmataceae bacterium]|nr:HAMP domain-containing sensor histidine kinase [Gemmataceae bacterium]
MSRPHNPMDANSPPAADDAAPARDGDRAARLLAVLQKALGHELPNVLVGVQGLARLVELEEAERLSADGRAYLGRLAAGAGRAHALVTALAEVARLGRPYPAAEPVDLAEVAAEAVAEAKQLATPRAVDYHGPEQSVILSAPRPALRKALVLLLRRAAAAGKGCRRVEVTARVVGNRAEVRVADDGPAVPPEKAGRLFEPFTDPDDPGLDLFLVAQLAEGWGGGARAESGPGPRKAIVLTCPVGRAV